MKDGTFYPPFAVPPRKQSCHKTSLHSTGAAMCLKVFSMSAVDFENINVVLSPSEDGKHTAFLSPSELLCNTEIYNRNFTLFSY